MLKFFMKWYFFNDKARKVTYCFYIAEVGEDNFGTKVQNKMAGLTPSFFMSPSPFP